MEFEEMSKKETAGKEMSWEDFQEKYRNFGGLVDEKESYFEEGSQNKWIRFESYDNGKVVIRDSEIDGSRKEISIDEFDNLLKIYTRRNPVETKNEEAG